MTVRSDIRPLLLGLALVTILSLAAGPARAESCGGRIAPPLVSVRTLAKPPVQDTSRGIAELSTDHSLAVPRGLEEFRFALGVTAAEAQGETSWRMMGTPQADGKMCWSVAQLQIIVTVATRVYIAREIQRGSCLWNEVVRHEAKHVRTDQKLFPEMSGLIRPKVVRAVSRSVPAADGNQARAILSQVISKAVKDAVADFTVTRDRLQLTIDTREEYSRANRVCGNAEVAAAVARAGLR